MVHHLYGPGINAGKGDGDKETPSAGNGVSLLCERPGTVHLRSGKCQHGLKPRLVIPPGPLQKAARPAPKLLGMMLVDIL